jgi:hypothetical protein
MRNFINVARYNVYTLNENDKEIRTKTCLQIVTLFFKLL